MDNPTDIPKFHGAKIALLAKDEVLVLLRDDFAEIPFPNCWDFPGGGVDFGETPIDCALRETTEEVGLSIPATAISWARPFHSLDGTQRSWFFVAEVSKTILQSARLGDEGQECRLMPCSEFLAQDCAVTYLQERLAMYLSTKS
ncbi:NUDIX domain protein [Rhodobacteraceae bacterium HTCC2150]|nr:NUDIX domain protein [Rhodobacteraceae bacterium HTCC2150]